MSDWDARIDQAVSNAEAAWQETNEEFKRGRDRAGEFLRLIKEVGQALAHRLSEEKVPLNPAYRKTDAGGDPDFLVWPIIEFSILLDQEGTFWFSDDYVWLLPVVTEPELLEQYRGSTAIHRNTSRLRFSRAQDASAAHDWYLDDLGSHTERSPKVYPTGDGQYALVRMTESDAGEYLAEDVDLADTLLAGAGALIARARRERSE